MAIAQSLRQTITSSLNKSLEREYGFLTSSGSSALISALHSSNIPIGSEVIMPAICCPAVLFAIQMAGFTPVLADVSMVNFSSNLEQIKRQVTNNTAAVVAVHGYGIACDIEAIEQYCQAHEIFLIEDACLAVGASVNGQPLGRFGDISIISFGYDKTIAEHYGGAIFTNRPEFAKRIGETLNANQFFQYLDDANKLSSLNAALAKLAEFNKERSEKVRFCHQTLSHKCVVKPKIELGQPLWRYPLLFKGDREKLIEQAAHQDIIITCHYKSLELLKTGWTLPNARQVSEQVINLFVRPEMPMAQLEKTISFINEFEA